MIGLDVIFYLLIILFAVIGMTRGWAKELLVMFSVILSLFILTVLEKFVPFIRDNLTGVNLFWLRASLLAALVFFGYQGPNIPRLAGSNRFVRERLQDSLLGIFLGALNGFLIWGTVWYFLQDAGYPFSFIYAPPAGETADAIQRLVMILPPCWLGTPVIYFAVAIAFAFVLVVFI